MPEAMIIIPNVHRPGVGEIGTVASTGGEIGNSRWMFWVVSRYPSSAINLRGRQARQLHRIHEELEDRNPSPSPSQKCGTEAGSEVEHITSMNQEYLPAFFLS